MSSKSSTEEIAGYPGYCITSDGTVVATAKEAIAANLSNEGRWSTGAGCAQDADNVPEK